jgi:hypothetical protein
MALLNGLMIIRPPPAGHRRAGQDHDSDTRIEGSERA